MDEATRWMQVAGAAALEMVEAADIQQNEDTQAQSSEARMIGAFAQALGAGNAALTPTQKALIPAMQSAVRGGSQPRPGGFKIPYEHREPKIR